MQLGSAWLTSLTEPDEKESAAVRLGPTEGGLSAVTVIAMMGVFVDMWLL